MGSARILKYSLNYLRLKIGNVSSGFHKSLTQIKCNCRRRKSKAVLSSRLNLWILAKKLRHYISRTQAIILGLATTAGDLSCNQVVVKSL